MTQHRDDGNPTKYFSMMLHIDHEDLNADEFYLLAYYRKIIGLNYGKPREEPITETAKGVKWKVDKTRDIRAKLASKGVIQITERSGKAQIVALADRNAANIERMKAQLATTSENSGRGKMGAIPNSDPSENGGGVSRENGGGVQAAVLKNTNNSIHKSTKVDLQSAVADVQSAPSQPQSSDGQPNSPEMPDSSAETTSTRRDGIEDLPKSSAKKVSADTTPKRAPLPHIAIIEQFVLPFKDVLPPDFKLGRYAALGMDLQKAGEDAERAASAGELYRAWYDATPGHQPSQLSWTVAGVTVAIRTALALAKAGIGGSQVHSFLAMRYTEAFWQDKTVSWKHVGEQIGRWLAKSSKVSEVPAIEMDENGMPIGYREMQEARRRADAIVAEKRRNGELR